MFDTNIVVVGNVLTAPEWRRTSNTNSLVANFRVASTARRLDRDSGRWVDGNHLRVRVTCWRRLAEGVAASIAVGDPVIVAGRLYTRDWTDNEGNQRTTYEMEAVAVGHDLARGRSRFQRNRPVPGTSAVAGPEEDGQVRGEAAELVPEHKAPVHYGDGILDDPTFLDLPGSASPGFDPLAELPDALEPASTALDRLDPGSPFDAGPAETDEIEIAVEALPARDEGAEPVGSRRSRRRQPVSA
ncbi:single-strand DNA-binding protein [Krasilnikovia cinnamomea]|uniref:Single-stranded DNA-binding protein n=1 Tax=Krasilnikovia cinnamomea TaxID=349313 RepID=A0A4Q7ZQ36_9ACTN|nr:single-stranded DNA-binding protein [Krasilnikovia cinnamomea]RZU52469.1 single-strand DNA-binding protein [Krasilnikovia cinnamomea]